MTTIVVIPARLAAVRLPGKPLADIRGTPMIVRVLRQAEAAAVGPVVVAAGDLEIVEIVEGAGGRAVLTDPALPSGTDRIVAALDKIDADKAFSQVINVQGDMPFIDPTMIRACATLLHRRADCDIATMVAPQADVGDQTNPDVVKAVIAAGPGPDAGRALYFTRSTLYGAGPIWRHVGIYGYQRAMLERFSRATPSPLEKREKLEQLRALELGMNIWAAYAPSAPISIDNAADLALARSFEA